LNGLLDILAHRQSESLRARSRVLFAEVVCSGSGLFGASWGPFEGSGIRRDRDTLLGLEMASPGQQESKEVIARLRSIDRTLNYLMALAILWFAVWLVATIGPG
jgi:hypothetical protein